MDKEKVIEGLHCCSHTDGVNCIYCPYDTKETDCTALMSMDVLELLKEQEAIEPTIDEYGKAYCICGENVGIIPRSKNLPSVRSKYCPECGRRIKWKYD